MTEVEGRTEVGELDTVWSVITKEAEAKEPVFIYTDSYTVFKGYTEWLPFWEQNQWKGDWLAVWQRDKGKKS